MGLVDGREETFHAIYDAYQRPLFSFAFYLSKSKESAEEVVQEVFIRLWEHRGTAEFVGPGHRHQLAELPFGQQPEDRHDQSR